MKVSAPFNLLVVSSFVSLACAATACAEPANRKAPRAATVKGKWTMQSKTLNGKTARPVPRAAVTIAFKGNRFSGSGGCNSFEGHFTMPKKGRIRIKEQSWTEIACDNPAIAKQEADCMKLFGKVNTIKVNAKQLVLSDGTAKNRIVFVPFKAPAPQSLTGTDWKLNTFEQTSGEGDSASVSATPVLRDAPITLRIDAGRAHGSTGCNQYSAKVTIGKGTLSFGPPLMTKKACRPEINRQERRLIAALKEVSQYEIRGNRLRLSNPKQTLVLHFTASK